MPITSAIAARATMRPGSPLGGAPPAARHNSTPIPISTAIGISAGPMKKAGGPSSTTTSRPSRTAPIDVDVAAVAEDLAVVVGGDEREQADVGDDADPPGEHQDDEGDPEEDRVDGEVAPEAAGDAADQLVGRGAGETPDALRGRRGVGFWGLRPALLGGRAERVAVAQRLGRSRVVLVWITGFFGHGESFGESGPRAYRE